MFTCLKCNYVKREGFYADADLTNASGVQICPKCGIPLVDVDEAIIQAVYLLNAKGYHTTQSCSGHAYETYCTAYIQFGEWVDGVPTTYPQLLSIPSLKSLYENGWVLEVSRYSITIRYNYHTLQNDVHSQREVNRAMTGLLNWVELIPIQSETCAFATE